VTLWQTIKAVAKSQTLYSGSHHFFRFFSIPSTPSPKFLMMSSKGLFVFVSIVLTSPNVSLEN
jgi:hypothetical protein